MDAKAKVVAVPLSDEQVVISKGLFIYEVDYSPEENWRGVRLDNVRKLIDKYEAAMTELRAELSAVVRDREQTIALHERLLTGLEALAGEWEKSWGEGYQTGIEKIDDATNNRASAKEECAAQLRTLTNSAKGNDDGR